MWEILHSDIKNAAKSIAETGKYDDAIFASFRLVEAAIQERISSRNIGRSLLDEAFDGTPPKIDISDDARDQEGIKQLFLGALGNIRNDRGHKKTPFLPCKTLENCLLYLNFASFLLYLLNKDRNIFPDITSFRLLGSSDQPRVELRGNNFDSDSQVFANEIQIKIERVDSTTIEAILPKGFNGLLKVITKSNESNFINCDTHFLNEKTGNIYEILHADIPLYADENCTQLILNTVGQLLRVKEGVSDFIRIIPTKGSVYTAGHYITHGPYSNESLEETWYKEPNSGEIQYAWSSSLIAKPDVIGKVGEFTVTNIIIQPTKIKTQLNERRTLRVIGYEKDGAVSQQVDLTSRISEWNSLDVNVAFVKNGVIIPKKLGKTKVECRLDQLVASASVAVEYHSKGDKVLFFKGIKQLQQIAFDSDDNLYFCNQTPSVYQIANDGGLNEVIRIAIPDNFHIGIDCIAIDKNQTLYVNDMYNRRCLRFLWDGEKYDVPQPIATNGEGARKSIAVDSKGNAFVTVMHGIREDRVICVKPDGSEFYFRTRDSAIYVAVDSQGKIYIPAASKHSIDVYDPDGSFIQSIYHGTRETPCDILIDNKDDIYIPFWETGRILKITNSSQLSTIETIATVNPHPGGIAMDSKGRIYISNFQDSGIEMIY